MRLIYADKLMQDIRNTITEQSSTIDWLNLINRQPTAYDVDKVVEQLEELNKYNLNLADCMLDIQSHGLNRHFICLEDAIEIVKGCGVE